MFIYVRTCVHSFWVQHFTVSISIDLRHPREAWADLPKGNLVLLCYDCLRRSGGRSSPTIHSTLVPRPAPPRPRLPNNTHTHRSSSTGLRCDTSTSWRSEYASTSG